MLDPTQQLLAYLVKKHDRASITVLMKLAYLIDLVSIKRLGRQVSKYSYIRYYYGPFDRVISADIQALLDSKVIGAKIEYVPSGEEYVVYYPNESSNQVVQLSPEDKVLVDEVLDMLKGYGARTLTEIAYKTKPMLKLQATLGGNEHLNSPLDMSAA